MSEISDLYHPLILEHSRSPRNFREPRLSDQKVEAYNPLCGDQFILHLETEENRITALGFSGYGCAVSKAATSVMLEKVQGLTFTEVKKMLDGFIRAIRDGAQLNDRDLAVFQVAQKYPGRKQCVLLTAEALLDYLNRKEK